MRTKQKCMKGQYFTFDAVVGAIIFMVTIGILLNYWYSMQAVIDARDETIYRSALRIADQLTSTPGTPENWNLLGISSVQQAGLMETWDNTSISYLKWNRLRMHSVNPSIYLKIRDEMFKTRGYDYYITINTFGAGCGGLTGDAGKKPAVASNSTVVKVNRIAPFKSGTSTCAANITVYLWR